MLTISLMRMRCLAWLKIENNPDSVMVFSGYFYTDEEGNVIGTEIKHSLSGSDLMNIRHLMVLHNV